MWWYLLWLLILVLLVIKFWKNIFRLLLEFFSRLNRKISLRFGDNVILVLPLVTSRLEAGIEISFPIPSLRWTCIEFGPVTVVVDVLKLRGKSAPQPTPEIVLQEVVKKTPSRLRWILGWLPRIHLQETQINIVMKKPTRVPTFADRTGGQPWTASVSLSNTLVRFELLHSRILLSISQVKGVCVVKDSRKIDWLDIEKFSTSLHLSGKAPAHIETRVDSISVHLNVEAYLMVIPTLGPLVEIPFIPADRKQPVPIKKIAISLGIVVSDKVSLRVTSDLVGSCDMKLLKLSFSLSSEFKLEAASEGGFVMTRDSPIHGEGEILTIAPFRGYGNGELIDIDIPSATIRTAPDGLVYWIRAMVMCGSKLSFTKRPYRIPIRNERTKIFHDFELCGIEPADWSKIARYVPKIIPVRIRINFVRDVLLKHMTKRSGSSPRRYGSEHVVISQGAVLDCNLPKEEIIFTARGVELFGRSKRRCALIKTFNCWAPMYSGMRLKDCQEILDLMGKPSDDIACKFAAPSDLGPIPVCIAFSDVVVEFAEDLIHYISRMVLTGIEDVRRWDHDIGYEVEPFYKPVTIRLSRLRFAPEELAPAVLDLKDWEMAIGPTKDCLNFAFIGVKAWVPSTVTVPPIIHCRDPAIVKIRVKRNMPIVKAKLASDQSMQPGSWRNLSLSVPQVRGAVAPGLHATTRFVDTVIKTVKHTFVSPPKDGLKRGPIRNVHVDCLPGCIIYVVKQSDRLVDSLSDQLAVVEMGRFEMDIANYSKKIHLQLSSIKISLLPRLGVIEVGHTTVVSSDSDGYDVELSKDRPLKASVTDNAMAILAGYSALKDAIVKAWYIDPRPKLNTVMTHFADNKLVLPLGDVSDTGSLETPPCAPTPLGVRSPLVSLNFSLACTGGLCVSWSLPQNPRGGLLVDIPPNQLRGEGVFHGFALMGDEIFRRLPDLTDQVLLQWLRYPWTVTEISSTDPSGGTSPTVNREKESWDLHAIMTMRISEYLSNAGEEGRWEYASNRGLIDTPMYAQVLLSLRKIQVCLGGSKILSGDKLEIRMHCHNLPTGGTRPKIKMSYWTSLEESPDTVCVDFSPPIHVPVLLTLVGSPADADPASKSIPGFVSSLPPPAEGRESPRATPAPKSAGTSILDRLAAHVDLGFRINVSGVTGRAAGWVFGASKICLFKEEDKGSGLVVMEIKNAQVGMETSLTVAEAVQPLHSTVCHATPGWIRSRESVEVFPFLSVRQMLLHIGLPSSDGPATIFCNIQKVRVLWSPSLSRGLRLSLSRSDDLVSMVSRWKQRFTSELYLRLGRSRKKKATFESIMKILDWFIPPDGSIKLVLRCGDVQLSFHNLANASEESLKPQSSSSNLRSPGSPDIPKHFLPFRETNVSSPQQSPVHRSDLVSVCDCTPRRTVNSKYSSGRYTTDYLNLEYPRSPSWWTLAAHLQGCALPPVPLMSLYHPPNSRKERAVGAIGFDKWISDCHSRRMQPIAPPLSPPGNAKPKPRGSQLVMVSAESVFEIYIVRIKGPSNVKMQLNASFGTIQGSVAPTALRGLVWLGESGQNILRQILQIDRIAFIISADLFPLRSAYARLLVPKIQLSTDDDAFQIVADVFRNCILYRGPLVDPKAASSASSGPVSSPPSTPPKVGTVNTGMPQGKRDAIVEGILTALAVADATLGTASEYLSVEYMVDSIGLSLNHRQRCFVTLQFKGIVGKQAFGMKHPHRPMQFSFQVHDIQILAADPMAGGDRTVLKSAGDSQSALLAIRGNDRYITLNNKEWHVYDSLFMSSSPLVIDVTQDLMDEIYAFIFPPNSGEASSSAPGLLNSQSSGHLPTVQEHVEVAGNKLLTGRNRSRNSTAGGGSSNALKTERKELSINTNLDKGPSSAPLIFFKFVRFGNIDSIITFKSKQFSLNQMALTVKYYLKRRRLATWKEFFDEWATKVGKQAFGAFVKHGFSRRKGIQDIIVNKLSPRGADVEKLLFGKFAN